MQQSEYSFKNFSTGFLIGEVFECDSHLRKSMCFVETFKKSYMLMFILWLVLLLLEVVVVVVAGTIES